MKKLVVILGMVAALVGLMTVGNAMATTVIDFSGQIGGTITTSGDIKGTDIVISSMDIANAYSNNGLFPVISGKLNFDVNAGTISITGGLGGPFNITDPSTVLLSGTITSSDLYQDKLGRWHFEAYGVDTKDRTLLTDIGLPSTTQFNFYNFSITWDGTTVNSTDMTNTAPEPCTLLLLGAGLTGLGLLRSRRKKA